MVTIPIKLQQAMKHTTAVPSVVNTIAVWTLPKKLVVTQKRKKNVVKTSKKKAIISIENTFYTAEKSHSTNTMAFL